MLYTGEHLDQISIEQSSQDFNLARFQSEQAISTIENMAGGNERLKNKFPPLYPWALDSSLQEPYMDLHQWTDRKGNK